MVQKSRTNKLKIALFLILFLGIMFPAFSHFASAGSMLDFGPFVNSKMKALAANSVSQDQNEKAEIKAIHMAESLPSDFIPSEANTVSDPSSRHPIYIFFDNENNAGIMYFYTDDNPIVMNPISAMMFDSLESLIDISGLADWDTSKVTNMGSLFCGAKSLPDALALKNWNTANVTDMSFMFSRAESLVFIDVSNWNTSNVTNMTCMFQVGESWAGNGQLKEIKGLGDLDVSNVTDMTCMFYGSAQMTYYDVSRWNVSKVESMNHMFCDNHSLISLDLSNWDVSSVKTICDMFDDCYSLKTIGDVSHWNTISLIDAGGWLNGATSFVGDNIGTLDLSGWDTSKLKSAGEMFRATIKLQIIDLSGWTFDSIINERWDGAGRGIYYETGNDSESYRGLGWMFNETPHLNTVYVSQSGLDSFNTVVEKGVSTLHMWTDSKISQFTVK